MSKNNPDSQTENMGKKGFTGNKQTAEDILRLSAVQTAQLTMNDTASFLRHNHMIYTAGISSVVNALLDGNERAHESFALLNTMLSESRQHFELMVKNTNALMGEKEEL
jgi:hypothetical protein